MISSFYVPGVKIEKKNKRPASKLNELVQKHKSKCLPMGTKKKTKRVHVF